MPDPGVITNFTWIFDETDTIFDVPNPTYDFETVGSHNIRLIVYTEKWLFFIFMGKSILIYEEPDVEIVFNTPLCNGSEDGVITVEIDIIGAVFNTEITNEAGEVLNAPGTQTVTGVGAGTYYINVFR